MQAEWRGKAAFAESKQHTSEAHGYPSKEIQIAAKQAPKATGLAPRANETDRFRLEGV